MEEMIAHGFNGTITLKEEGVHIKPGVVGHVLKGGNFLSEKFIPYDSISGVELRKGFPIIGEGSLQINTKGEIESEEAKLSKGEAIDSNIVRFAATLNAKFEMIAEEIKKRSV
jgi:hypothetical protein